MTPKREQHYQFSGFDNPNTTPVPDVIFDELLTLLREAELKALLYICRRTFGFKKDRDSISFNQFLKGITTREGKVLDRGCGVKDRTTLSRALKSLVELGIVIADKGVDERGENTTTVYRLRFKGEPIVPAEQNNTPRTSPSPRGSIEPTRVVGNSYHPGRNLPLPVVGDSYPQETVLQETVLQEIDLSNIREVSPTQNSLEETPAVQQPMDLQRAGIPLPSPARRPRRDFSRVADLLPQPASDRPSMKRLRAQKGASEERQIIIAMMDDFATEMGDEAPLAVTVQRTFHLWERSKIPIEAFTALMYEARAVTKEYSGNITKTRRVGAVGGSAWGPGKNKIPYFFKTLESILAQHSPAVTHFEGGQDRET
jgi:hypothetical protein